MSDPIEEHDWPSNYFNYFTEAEEHFQRARGTSLFLLSPIDWALLEIWKNSGVPLEAVLRGIDMAFEKWRSKKSKVQAVNSLTYCAQAVLKEAQVMAGAIPERASKPVEAPFSIEELRGWLTQNREQLEKLGLAEIAKPISNLLNELEVHYADLEALEQRLSALEEKMVALARSRQDEESLFQARRALETELRPYRSKMTADQLSMLERNYLDRRLLESAGLPRLSLFYLR